MKIEQKPISEVSVELTIEDIAEQQALVEEHCFDHGLVYWEWSLE